MPPKTKKPVYSYFDDKTPGSTGGGEQKKSGLFSKSRFFMGIKN
jgi:hypothetical protein